MDSNSNVITVQKPSVFAEMNTTLQACAIVHPAPLPTANMLQYERRMATVFCS